MARHPFLAHRHPLAFAHRGGAGEAPENSVASFRAATDLGFSHLETDVQLTSDGVLVAFHDPELDRATDATGRVADLPWHEVAKARIGGAEPIPTLDELFETFPDAYFNIEPKSDPAVVALARAVRHHDALHRVCIGAFSDSRLRRIRGLLGPDVCTTAGPRETATLVATLRLGRRARRAARTPSVYQCAQVPVRFGGVDLVTSTFIEGAHARGVQVHVWTIDDATEMHRLLELGVDGIMTDRPSVLRSVLVERGQWD